MSKLVRFLYVLLTSLVSICPAFAQPIATFAGLSPSHRASIDGKNALTAPLLNVYGVFFEPASGRLLIHDGLGVYRLEADGTLTAIVGIGRNTFDGDIVNGTLASNLRLSALRGMAEDSSGNLYLSDAGFGRVYRIDLNGIVTTYVGGDGTLPSPRGLAFDSADNLYVAEVNCACIRRVQPDGTASVVYSLPRTNLIQHFEGISFDSSGNLLAAEFFGGSVLRIQPDGTATSIADGLNHPTDVKQDAQGNIWISETGANRLLMVAPDGSVTVVSHNGDLSQPAQITFDSAGTLFVADYINRRVRRLNPDGSFNTIAGSGANDLNFTAPPILDSPSSVVIDSANNLYVAEPFANRISKIAPDGTVTHLATLPEPTTLTFDPSGTLYSASIAGYVSKIDPQGNVTVVAGTGTGTGPIRSQGDGGPAIQATLNEPKGVAVDRDGNIYVADTSNARLRKVDTSGVITTIAGPGILGTDYWNGVALDPSGHLYVSITHAPPMGLFSYIARVESDGSLTTVAGNKTCPPNYPPIPLLDGLPALEAPLCSVLNIRFDAQGNLYFAEPAYDAIYRIGLDGIITRLAGVTGAFTTIGDGGPALNAYLGALGGYVSPADMAFDSQGNLFIPQAGFGRIREVLAQPITARAIPGPIAADLTESLQVVTNVTEPLPYAVRVRSDNNFLTANRTTGLTGEPVRISISTRGLSSGSYKGTVVILVPSASPSEIDVPIQITVP